MNHYEPLAEKLRYELEGFSGVQHALMRWEEGNLAVAIVVTEDVDWDVRAAIIESIDYFHQEHVHEFGLTMAIMNEAYAGSLAVVS